MRHQDTPRLGLGSESESRESLAVLVPSLAAAVDHATRQPLSSNLNTTRGGVPSRTHWLGDSDPAARVIPMIGIHRVRAWTAPA